MDSDSEIYFVYMLANGLPNDHLGSDPFSEVVDDKRCKHFLENAFRFFLFDVQHSYSIFQASK